MRLLSVTTGLCLDARVETQALETAIIDAQSGREVSWCDLNRRVDKIARGLLAKGLKKGDRLGIWAPNSIDWVTCFLAAAKTGIIALCINIHFKERELEDILSECRLTALCFADGFRDNNFNQIIKHLPHNIVPGLLIGLGTNHDSAVLPLTEIIEHGASVSAEKYTESVEAVSHIDPLVIQLTSGSTAMPKRVILSHRNITNNAIFSAQRLGIDSTDVLCLAIPLFHCFGLVSGLYFSLMTGCRLVILDSYNTEEILSAVQRYRCTTLHGVPTIFNRLIQHETLAQYAIDTLKKGIVAGAFCPEQLIRDITHRLGMSGIVVSYGQTETSPCCTQGFPSDSLMIKGSTIGKPLPYVEMCVIDWVTGELCAPGDKGELCTRGYHLMAGYDGDPQKTQHVIDSHGWFHSGDIGFVDRDGYFHYLWRKKDIIIRGGENISPREIESAIAEFPEVESVCVFGLASESLGEVVAAAVCPKNNMPLSESALMYFLHQRLARYKVPAHIFFFSTFPLTACGKIDIQSVRFSINKLFVSFRE
ncbi:AMP-binding protein [Escherichia albertii]|uniref:AMP-binding protein n=1 Tax=Escherichia albertii TaxID=208962 RepID=UPI0016B4EB05|nr:AMP-binding protein [Escherichia albertii]MCE7710692.1 AMP-binding protein [Escherichia albertii]MCZ7511505.1 AMP-binding protein [Escherichia albertii]MCZ8859818.1 AMP-binding protein [Escherichia albertii]HBM9793033.1 AMP-binding protein [Escherichia albertii]